MAHHGALVGCLNAWHVLTEYVITTQTLVPTYVHPIKNSNLPIGKLTPNHDDHANYTQNAPAMMA